MNTTYDLEKEYNLEADYEVRKLLHLERMLIQASKAYAEKEKESFWDVLEGKISREDRDLILLFAQKRIDTIAHKIARATPLEVKRMMQTENTVETEVTNGRSN